VVAANPTYTEAVEDGVTALCAASAEDWTRHLESLAGSSSLRAEIAAKAREACLVKYPSDRAAKVYQQLLHGSGC
jgi:Glycosyl transferases group 1